MKNYITFVLSLFVFSPITSTFADKEPPKKVIVFIREAKPVLIADELIYPARVESKINANLVSESEGQIKKIDSPLGTRVKRGQVLMSISHTDPIFEYRSFKIKSPIAGIVSGLSVSEGSLVKKGDLLVTITDPKDLQIRIEVPASDRKWVRPGMKGEFFDSQESKTTSLSVELSGLSPQIDALTGTSVGLLRILSTPKSTAKSSDGRVASEIGTTGQVRFKVNERNVLQVPETAVSYRDQDSFLKIVKDQKVEEIKVSLGASLGGKVEVLSGLQPSDEVVERSSRFVNSGETVEVTREEKGATKSIEKPAP